MKIRMHTSGLKIVEVPSVERPRHFGQSNLRTFCDGLRVLTMIASERIAFSRAERKQVPILMYHSISDYAGPKFKQFTVPPKLFAEHLAYLHQHSYTPMTVTEFVMARSNVGNKLPERPVLLTFDDGFADFYTEALPILKRYGFAATLYVVTGYINKTSRWLRHEGETERPMLSWDQLREILASGIECGGHTHSHPQLDTLTPAEVYREIVQNKKLLEDQLGQNIFTFAYPYGYQTASIRRQVQESGYTSACAVRHTMSSTETRDSFSLARLMVKFDTSVDSLAALLNDNWSQRIAGMYLRARTPVWQIMRRSSASMRRYLRKGVVHHDPSNA